LISEIKISKCTHPFLWYSQRVNALRADPELLKSDDIKEKLDKVNKTLTES